MSDDEDDDGTMRLLDASGREVCVRPLTSADTEAAGGALIVAQVPVSRAALAAGATCCLDVVVNAQMRAVNRDGAQPVAVLTVKPRAWAKTWRAKYGDRKPPPAPNRAYVPLGSLPLRCPLLGMQLMLRAAKFTAQSLYATDVCVLQYELDARAPSRADIVRATSAWRGLSASKVRAIRSIAHLPEHVRCVDEALDTPRDVLSMLSWCFEPVLFYELVRLLSPRLLFGRSWGELHALNSALRDAPGMLCLPRVAYASSRWDAGLGWLYTPDAVGRPPWTSGSAGAAALREYNIGAVMPIEPTDMPASSHTSLAINLATLRARTGATLLAPPDEVDDADVDDATQALRLTRVFDDLPGVAWRADLQAAKLLFAASLGLTSSGAHVDIVVVRAPYDGYDRLRDTLTRGGALGPHQVLGLAQFPADAAAWAARTGLDTRTLAELAAASAARHALPDAVTCVCLFDAHRFGCASLARLLDALRRIGRPVTQLRLVGDPDVAYPPADGDQAGCPFADMYDASDLVAMAVPRAPTESSDKLRRLRAALACGDAAAFDAARVPPSHAMHTPAVALYATGPGAAASAATAAGRRPIDAHRPAVRDVVVMTWPPSQAGVRARLKAVGLAPPRCARLSVRSDDAVNPTDPFCAYELQPLSDLSDLPAHPRGCCDVGPRLYRPARHPLRRLGAQDVRTARTPGVPAVVLYVDADGTAADIATGLAAATSDISFVEMQPGCLADAVRRPRPPRHTLLRHMYAAERAARAAGETAPSSESESESEDASLDDAQDAAEPEDDDEVVMFDNDDAKDEVVVAEQDEDDDEIVVAEDNVEDEIVVAEDAEDEVFVAEQDEDDDEIVVAEDNVEDEIVVAEDDAEDEVFVAEQDEDDDDDEVVVAEQDEDDDDDEVVVADQDEDDDDDDQDLVACTDAMSILPAKRLQPDTERPARPVKRARTQL